MLLDEVLPSLEKDMMACSSDNSMHGMPTVSVVGFEDDIGIVCWKEPRLQIGLSSASFRRGAFIYLEAANELAEHSETFSGLVNF